MTLREFIQNDGQIFYIKSRENEIQAVLKPNETDNQMLQKMKDHINHPDFNTTNDKWMIYYTNKNDTLTAQSFGFKEAIIDYVNHLQIINPKKKIMAYKN